VVRAWRHYSALHRRKHPMMKARQAALSIAGVAFTVGFAGGVLAQ
jgi:hypothetical protein